MNGSDGSPFDDYLIPGIILFLILGLSCPLIISFGLWKTKTLGMAGKSIALAAALVIWILVEILIIGWQTDTVRFSLLYGVSRHCYL
ncbi:MAG: hypothetical protein U5K00_08655 [Melioribacteraceae bacterium]|nr:hypothetical protein [Melioribacteraceae bacterium]